MSAHRVDWLDGIRGLAALFVVLHHAWLATWPAYPANTGPWFLEPLLYGHLAVAVFIVVSGYSLALRPARHGLELDARAFIGRRAWRILPAYWAALVVSTLVTFTLLQPDTTGPEVAKGFLVHGLLLQDVIGSVTPNGAFWSIAVEWQIYFAFPLILIAARRWGLRTAVALTLGVVVLAHLSQVAKIDYLTPQFLALFAFGVLAAAVKHNPGWLKPAAIATLAATAALAATQGPEWITARYFWVDLVFGAAAAAGLALMHHGGLTPVRLVLASRMCAWLGLISYSVYLVHAPLVQVAHRYAVDPLEQSALVEFAALLLLVPVIVAAAFVFHLAFEAPFLRHRNIRALRLRARPARA